MKINFVGDIGIFRKYEELGIDPFTSTYLPESDLNIGNFEFIISESRNKYFYDVQDQYSCSFEYLKKLNTNKFQGFGFANNHCIDYGLDGALETINYLKKKGIQVFGFTQNTDYTIGKFEINGSKIGIIACVKEGRWSKEKNGFGPDTYSTEAICKIIEKCKSDFDHIIVYPHWGTELIEIPEFQDTINARKFIDSGASAVIGHHPHVSQGLEVYKKGLIAYSLGSFIYVHEEEMGYGKNVKNRDISICLNIEFNKVGIKNFKAYYFKYDFKRKIPVILDEKISSNYAGFLNNNIYNRRLFRKQLYMILLKRELKSFSERFKSDPVRTIINYFKILKIKHLKKLIS